MKIGLKTANAEWVFESIAKDEANNGRIDLCYYKCKDRIS